MLSAALKAWRDARGFTQREAAGDLSVAFKTYLDWEQGRHAPRGLALSTVQQKISRGVKYPSATEMIGVPSGIRKLPSEKKSPAGASLKSNPESSRPKVKSPSPPASGARTKRVTHAKKTISKKRRA